MKQNLIQKQTLSLKKAVETDLRMYQKCLGKIVIMEEGEAQQISVGRLTANGYDNVQIQNYSRWDGDVYFAKIVDYIHNVKEHPDWRNEKPFIDKNIYFSTSEINLRKSNINSMQPLEHIIGNFPISELGLTGFDESTKSPTENGK